MAEYGKTIEKHAFVDGFPCFFQRLRNRKFNEKLEELRSLVTEEDDTTKNKMVRKLSGANTDFAGLVKKNTVLDAGVQENQLKFLVNQRRKGSLALARLAKGKLNYVDFPEDRARNFLTRNAERKSIVKANTKYHY